MHKAGPATAPSVTTSVIKRMPANIAKLLKVIVFIAIAAKALPFLYTKLMAAFHDKSMPKKPTTKQRTAQHTVVIQVKPQDDPQARPTARRHEAAKPTSYTLQTIPEGATLATEAPTFEVDTSSPQTPAGLAAHSSPKAVQVDKELRRQLERLHNSPLSDEAFRAAMSDKYGMDDTDKNGWAVSFDESSSEESD